MAFSIIFPQRAQDIRHFSLFHEDPVNMACTKPQRLYVRIVWIVCTYGDPSK